jgi:hypothetical protein
VWHVEQRSLYTTLHSVKRGSGVWQPKHWRIAGGVHFKVPPVVRSCSAPIIPGLHLPRGTEDLQLRLDQVETFRLMKQLP